MSRPRPAETENLSIVSLITGQTEILYFKQTMIYFVKTEFGNKTNFYSFQKVIDWTKHSYWNNGELSKNHSMGHCVLTLASVYLIPELITV